MRYARFPYKILLRRHHGRRSLLPIFPGRVRLPFYISVTLNIPIYIYTYYNWQVLDFKTVFSSNFWRFCTSAYLYASDALRRGRTVSPGRFVRRRVRRGRGPVRHVRRLRVACRVRPFPRQQSVRRGTAAVPRFGRRVERRRFVPFHRERVSQFYALRVPFHTADDGFRRAASSVRLRRLVPVHRVDRVLDALRAARPQVYRRLYGRRQVARRTPVQYLGHCV